MVLLRALSRLYVMLDGEDFRNMELVMATGST
jgi:hypothetical protein